MSGEHPLLVFTDPGQDGDGEPVRVALDVLRAATQVKVVSPAGPAALSQALEKRGKRRPVVVGGDELLHTVVQALHQRRELAGSLIGWVPLRARYDLAGMLGLPADPAGAARIVLSGVERWLDLLVDDAGTVAVNSVRVGAPAVPSDQPPGSPPLAWFAARISARLGLLPGGPHRGGWRLRVEADGTVLTDLDRRVAVVGLGNGSDVAGGALAADISPDDGLAEVVVAEAPRRPWPGQPAARLGEHAPREGVRTARAKAVTVSGQDFPYAADDVQCGPVRLRTWTVEHSAWRLTVPTLR